MGVENVGDRKCLWRLNGKKAGPIEVSLDKPIGGSLLGRVADRQRGRTGARFPHSSGDI
jgi:hypothetical protein